MATPRKLKAKIELHPQYKVPRRIYEIEEKTTGAEPRQIAETFLKRIASDLDIKTDLSDLKFDQVKHSILGNHALFQQYHHNKPISGAWVRVDIDKTGHVYNVHNDLVPERVLAKTETRVKAARRGALPQLSQEQARARALDATGSSATNPHEIVEQEQVYYPVKGEPTAAWKVVVRSTHPAGEWKVYVDAASGEILRTINLLKDQDGRGRIFDPNPVATLNDTFLEDTSTIPDVAYQEVVLRDLDNSGHLDGKFVSTRPTSNRVKRSDGKFLFKRSDRGFKEVMVYFHIDRVQRYLQELGFTNVLNRAIEVSVDGIPDDNSFYSPLSKSLTFGTGGVDDAEDAEIILHEYGHAIQDAQVSGFGSGREARAMGEGFGDYLAASFFADLKPERLRPTVGNWDAVAYSGDDPPSLRRLDSNKKYPRDMVGEEHADGEIWSACLWQLRNALGGQIADRLVLAHHVLLAPEASFEGAAQALITADQQLHGGRNGEAIREIFVRRGILPNRKRKNRRAGIPFAEIHRHNRRTSTRRRTARKGR
jgi:Zn-dependent metalloprotease